MNELDQQRALYPRVTDIIGRQNADEMRGINFEVLANASYRGTQVHNYCTAWIRGLWLPEIEMEYQPYLNAFIEWAEANIETCLHFSERLYDDVKRFTGEFDLIVKLKTGETALIDIKTSAAPSKTWPIQLSAYQHLCKLQGYEFEKILILHLKKKKAAVFEEKEGKKLMISPPHVKGMPLEYGDDLTFSWEIFSSALKCYDYFCRKEPKK